MGKDKLSTRLNGKSKKEKIEPTSRIWGTDKLPENWREIIQETYESGQSDFMVCKNLHMGWDRFTRMRENDQEFKGVINQHWPSFAGYWTELLRKLANGECKGNVAAAIFSMKNMLKDHFGDTVEFKNMDRSDTRTDKDRVEQVVKLLEWGIRQN